MFHQFLPQRMMGNVVVLPHKLAKWEGLFNKLHVNAMKMIINHSVPWQYYHLIPLMYHDIATVLFLPGRSQWEVVLVFILRIHCSVVEIIAETIFSHHVFYVSEFVCLGWRSFAGKYRNVREERVANTWIRLFLKGCVSDQRTSTISLTTPMIIVT